MNLERTLNALLVFILMGVICAAFVVQFGWREQPCPLCLLQRIGMIGVAFGALMNIFFGVSRFHYALSFFSALFGAGVALRQIGIHVCPPSHPFGSPVLGLSLYTWSFIVFICAMTYIAILLCLPEEKEEELPISGFGYGAFGLTVFVVLVNLFATVFQCGLFGPCE